MKISLIYLRVSEFLSKHDFQIEIFKGEYFHKNVNGVIVLVLCNLPDSEEWSGGAMVLDKLPVPGRPTSLDKCRARAYCACSRCGWGCLDFYTLLSIIFHFFLPLSGRRPDID